MTEPQPEPARVRRGVPGWLFVVVPMLLAALLVGGVSIAVRSSTDDGGAKAPDLSGPPASLPAVTDAATELLDGQPAAAAMAEQLGTKYGQVTLGLGTVTDEVQFAQQFERLPDAEAKLLGRTLGAIQAQLTPEAAGGPRKAEHRADDIAFALALSRAMVLAAEPDAAPRDQALAVLPFTLQDLDGFDSFAATFADGDLTSLAPHVDGALTAGGAAELVSSIAFLMGQRIPSDNGLGKIFTDAYNAELP